MSTNDSTSDSKRRRSRRMKPLKLVAMALLVAAVVKELRLPKHDRTWHGALAGFVPYDLRKPTFDRIKATFWNPDGSIIVGRAFGVGWTINFGAVVARLRSLFDHGA